MRHRARRAESVAKPIEHLFDLRRDVPEECLILLNAKCRPCPSVRAVAVGAAKSQPPEDVTESVHRTVNRNIVFRRLEMRLALERFIHYQHLVFKCCEWTELPRGRDESNWNKTEAFSIPFALVGPGGAEEVGHRTLAS
jgi:hypothetical protein